MKVRAIENIYIVLANIYSTETFRETIELLILMEKFLLMLLIKKE